MIVAVANIVTDVAKDTTLLIILFKKNTSLKVVMINANSGTVTASSLHEI
jgi:hypothetical protein